MAFIAALAQAALSIKQQNDAAEYQAKVDANNVKLAKYQAGDAIQRGGYGARRAEIAGRWAQSQARAQIEAGNISSTSGSAANAITASGINAAADAAQIRANAAREVWGFQNQAADTAASSDLRKRASYMNELGTGVQGIGTAYAQWRAGRAQ